MREEIEALYEDSMNGQAGDITLGWNRAIDAVLKIVDRHKDDHHKDELIEQIKQASLGKWYVGRIDGRTDEVVLMDEVIEILEGAK